MKKYDNDYLKEVLIRVDFGVPIVEINEQLKPELTKTILTYFKIFEQERIPRQSIRVEGTQVFQEMAEEVSWNYYGKNREKLCKINQAFLLISYKDYDTYNKLKAELETILGKLYEQYPDLQVRRIGMRYINEIELYEKQPTKWEDYLNPHLLSIFDVSEDKKTISRAMSNLEFNFDDYKLRFQYGMHNPDYPAPVKRKLFILDYDCYLEGFIESLNEGLEFVDQAHSKIEDLFESCITDKLRENMSGDDE